MSYQQHLGDATDTADMESGEKPWWQSRAMWGGVVAAAAGIVGIYGYDLDQSATTDLIMSVVAVAGGAVAVYGRAVASRPIKKLRKQ